MKVVEQVLLKFEGVDILKLNFNISKKLDENAVILVNSTPKLYYPKEDLNAFKVFFELELKNAEEESFNLDILAVGHFICAEKMSEEIKKQIINRNAPAIMFPYLRSFISTITANVGLIMPTHLVIPPQTFEGEVEILSEIDQKKERLEK